MPRLRKYWNVTCMAVLLCCRVVAQIPAADPSTLHMYVNRMQIPVLVLGPNQQELPPIAPDHFKIMLEGVGAIEPSRVRLEGDDPIAMALVVDRSDENERLWSRLRDALAPLTEALKSQDRVSVYVMDGCTARRVGDELVKPDAEQLRLAAETVRSIRTYEQRSKSGACPRPVRYEDLLRYAANRIAAFPGRKILVALGAPASPLEEAAGDSLRSVLNRNSVALFPIVHGEVSERSVLPHGKHGEDQVKWTPTQVDLFTPMQNSAALTSLALQAELSGGMMLGTSERSFAKTLARPLRLARGRYILEFPRPASLLAGSHALRVMDGRQFDFIRPAGISVPVAGPGEHSDAPVTDASTASAVAVPPAKAVPAAAMVPAPVTKPSVAVPPRPIDPTDITGELRPSH